MIVKHENEIPMLSEIEAKAITKLKQKVTEQLTLRKLILFGSKARGDFHSDSDVDLLVLVEEPKTVQTRMILSDIQFDVIMEYLDAPLMCKLENYDSWIKDTTGLIIKDHVMSEGIEIEL